MCISEIRNPGQNWKEDLMEFENELSPITGNFWFHEDDIPSCMQMLENLCSIRKCEEEAKKLNKERQDQQHDAFQTEAHDLSDSEVWCESQGDSVLDVELLPILDIGNARRQCVEDFVINGCRKVFTYDNLRSILNGMSLDSAAWILGGTNLMTVWDSHIKNVPEVIPIISNCNQTVENGILIMDDVVQKFNLNTEQRLVLKIVADHVIEKRSEQLLFCIGGEAGTGKSQVIHGIVELFRRWRKLEMLCVCGTTGTAAAKIGGSTLHSTFKLRQKNLRIGSNAYTSLSESLG